MNERTLAEEPGGEGGAAAPKAHPLPPPLGRARQLLAAAAQLHHGRGDCELSAHSQVSRCLSNRLLLRAPAQKLTQSRAEELPCSQSQALADAPRHTGT